MLLHHNMAFDIALRESSGLGTKRILSTVCVRVHCRVSLVIGRPHGTITFHFTRTSAPARRGAAAAMFAVSVASHSPARSQLPLRQAPYS